MPEENLSPAQSSLLWPDCPTRRFTMTENQEKTEGFLKRFAKATREFVYGMSTYETVRLALGSRASIERIFLLIVMGDFLGVPIMRPYYTLRILPYVVPKIEKWKHMILREKDITDALSEG
jgi:hypothetical protein